MYVVHNGTWNETKHPGRRVRFSPRSLSSTPLERRHKRATQGHRISIHNVAHLSAHTANGIDMGIDRSPGRYYVASHTSPKLQHSRRRPNAP